MIDYKLKQDGYCSTCSIETGDIYYIFCSKECNEIWYALFGSKGKQMSDYDIDKDVYVKWLEEKMLTIENMNREQIESRIVEIKTIEFYARREWAILHQQYDKITGRKGIAPWLKAERDKLITDPDVQVNFDGEPRKKEKKKSNLVKDLLDIDIDDIKREQKEKQKAKKLTMDEALEELASAMSEPPKPKVTATEDEIKAKADALREKMRLAKEANKEKAS